MNPFARSVEDRLKEAGLPDTELISSTPDSPSFGNAEVVFRSGPVLLHFVKDRGQELLDVASVGHPNEFFLFEDLDIAMGWKTIDEVLAKREPERLEAMLGRLRQYFEQLADAFSGERERFTRARIERAARERGQAFVKRLTAKT